MHKKGEKATMYRHTKLTLLACGAALTLLLTGCSGGRDGDTSSNDETGSPSTAGNVTQSTTAENGILGNDETNQGGTNNAGTNNGTGETGSNSSGTNIDDRGSMGDSLIP